MVVVDTSVLYAAAAGREEPYRSEALSLLYKAGECIVVAPSIVVHELVWSLRRSLGRREAEQAVRSILPLVVVEPVSLIDIEEGLRNVKKYNDLLVISVARRLGASLATFDREMAKIARKLGVRLYMWRAAEARGITSPVRQETRPRGRSP